MIDGEGPAPPIVGGASPGLVVLGSLRKLASHESSTPQWLLQELLPPSSYPALVPVWISFDELLCYQYWALPGTPLGYPIVILCHGDPVALDLQVRPLHLFQQFIDEVGVGVGYLVILVLVWVVAGLISLPAFPHHHPGKLSSTAPLAHLM